MAFATSGLAEGGTPARRRPRNLALALGPQTIIPPAPLSTDTPTPGSADWSYLQQVQAEHESIFDAISARTRRSPRA
jgi:hypothetical protein